MQMEEEEKENNRVHTVRYEPYCYVLTWTGGEKMLFFKARLEGLPQYGFSAKIHVGHWQIRYGTVLALCPSCKAESGHS